MLLSPANPVTPAPMHTLPLPVMLKPAKFPTAVLSLGPSQIQWRAVWRKSQRSVEIKI